MPKLTGLKLERLKRGWTTRIVANKLGISETWLSKWENMLYTVPGKHLQKLEEIYGVSREELLKDLTEPPAVSRQKDRVRSEENGR